MYHPMGNSDPVVDSASINSSLSLKENAVFHCKALSYCCPYFVISETFDRRISLLLLLNYLNCFRLDQICIFLVEITRSTQFLIHGFLLLILMSLFLEINFFCFQKQNRTDLFCFYKKKN